MEFAFAWTALAVVIMLWIINQPPSDADAGMGVIIAVLFGSVFWLWFGIAVYRLWRILYALDP